LNQPTKCVYGSAFFLTFLLFLKKKQCTICYTDIPLTEQHWLCPGTRPNTTTPCGLFMCGECFPDWLNGRNRDNRGWINPQCWRCKDEIDYQVIKELLGDKFEVFDDFCVRMTLALTKNVIWCPGVDCPQVYLKPPSRAEKKRRAPGNARCMKYNCQDCDTPLCILCGEKWVDAHEGISCTEYAKWKQQTDEHVLELKKWRGEQKESIVKNCPGCNKMTEKNGGCPSHWCTLCGINFCWNCLTQYNQCRCAAINRRKREKLAKKRAKRKAKREAARIAKGGKPRPATNTDSNNNDVISKIVVGVSPGSRVPARRIGGLDNDNNDIRPPTRLTPPPRLRSPPSTRSPRRIESDNVLVDQVLSDPGVMQAMQERIINVTPIESDLPTQDLNVLVFNPSGRAPVGVKKTMEKPKKKKSPSPKKKLTKTQKRNLRNRRKRQAQRNNSEWKTVTRGGKAVPAK